MPDSKDRVGEAGYQTIKYTRYTHKIFKCGSRGGLPGDPDPPGKSQVIWVYIGNKELDPPGKSWTPLENVGPPSGTLKMIDFFEIDHLTSVK